MLFWEFLVRLDFLDDSSILEFAIFWCFWVGCDDFLFGVNDKFGELSLVFENTLAFLKMGFWARTEYEFDLPKSPL